MRCKSELEVLNLPLPNFRVTPQCGNTAYDANCTLVRATYTTAGTVSAATATTVRATTAGIVAKADGYYNLGVIAFTSGALNGLLFSVATFTHTSPATFNMALPFGTQPQAGDTFNVYPGCDRTYATCDSRFSNLTHHRGFPHIPKPETGA